jgi:hypothetical protein
MSTDAAIAVALILLALACVGAAWMVAATVAERWRQAR